MRHPRLGHARALFAALALGLAAEFTLPQANTSAEQFVQAALRSELDGPSDVRSELLKQALSRDPDYAPARWQSGFVRWDARWLTPDEVAKRAAHDPLLAEYRKRRDAMVDKADDHRELAAWCHKNKLIDGARVHWVKVLEFEPNDDGALAALGLQSYEGRLLTRQQIEQAKKAAVEQRRANQRWQPQIVKWRAAIDHGTAKQREAAIAELAEISDPGALPALEAVFGVTGDTKKALELNQLLVETAGRIPGPEATAVLLRRSLAPDSLEMRAAAADQLKARPMHAYVPQLIAALPGSLSTKFQLTILPNGAVVHEHQVLIEGRTANVSMTYASAVSPADRLMAMFLTPAAAYAGLQNAAAIESGASATQARVDLLRGRIQFVLERTTGFANFNDSELWEKQYNDYNGWYTPPQYKPTYYQSAYDNRGAASAPIDLVLRYHSCFSAGTQILTLLGSTPIDKIKVGDRVLAQNIETGELAYQPVQSTTLRPATPLLDITLGSECIRATSGHPFWVTGEGWRTAKRLKVGDRLQVLHGVAVVERIEQARPSEVYNLVVSELHNYFVGSSRLLAHDNSPLLERAARIPGLATEKP